MNAKSRQGKISMTVFARLPLTVKFLSVVLPFSVTVTMFALLYLQITDLFEQRHSLEGRIQTSASNLASDVLADLLEAGSLESIERLLAGILTDPDIKAISLFSADGLVRVDAGSVDRPMDTVKTVTSTVRTSTSESTLQIHYIEDRILGAAQSWVSSAVIVTLIVTIVLIIGALLALSHTVQYPLRLFGKAIRQATKNDTFVPIYWKSGDALGQVASAYNRLQAKQFEDERALKELSQNLETLVDERTSEATVAREQAERNLRNFEIAQDRLVQSEKLASLGQLTAGIAHEIKNPLNFINNFSSLSVEMLEELQEVMDRAKSDISEELRDEVEELMGMVSSNMGKVQEHGKRADGIVRNMLLHSRHDEVEATEVAINSVVSEAMNLAFHSARAENKSFNIDMINELSEDAGSIHCYAQEISRVFINLISNGMYAAYEHSKETQAPATLTVRSRSTAQGVEIDIADNGMGIKNKHLKTLFDPFFTTKPAGEGTGLGLSISHDIVTKQHGGRISVSTKVGEGTCFTVILHRSLPGKQT